MFLKVELATSVTFQFSFSPRDKFNPDIIGLARGEPLSLGDLDLFVLLTLYFNIQHHNTAFDSIQLCLQNSKHLKTFYIALF